MPGTSRIVAELHAPEIVYLPVERGSTVHVDVLAQLHNTGADDFVVGTSDPEDVHNWHVLGENAREVSRALAADAGEGREGVHPHRSQLLPAGQSHNHSTTLPLDAKKLKPGRRYTVRYAFHGYVAEAAFTVLAGGTPARKAPASKKKAPAPKAPAAKKKAPA
ncbi:MAG: hypothetical protein ACYTG4_16705, partial [Planctomycetota bacterium]